MSGWSWICSEADRVSSGARTTTANRPSRAPAKSEDQRKLLQHNKTERMTKGVLPPRRERLADRSNTLDPYYLDFDAGTLSPTEPTTDGNAVFRARKDMLMFRSRPVEEEVEITRPLAMKLFAASSTGDADLFVNVHLFDPDAAEILFTTAFEPRATLAQGWLRMSHRALDSDRSQPHQPWHPHDRIEPVEPQRVYELDVEVWPTSIVVPPGYSIGVSVCGVDYVHQLPGEHHIAYGRELLRSRSILARTSR